MWLVLIILLVKCKNQSENVYRSYQTFIVKVYNMNSYVERIAIYQIIYTLTSDDSLWI